MHYHASSCITSSNLDLDAHSKGRCGKWIFHDANRMLRLQPLPPLQSRCLKRQWSGHVRGCQGSSAVTTFSGHNLVHQCSSTPWKGNNRYIYIYRMSQMNLFLISLCCALWMIIIDCFLLTISCIIMHHHAYLPAILTWMPIQKVGVAKAISMMPTGCSVYRRALHCKTAAWRGNGYRGCHRTSGDVRGAVQEPPFPERILHPMQFNSMKRQ